MADSTSPDGTDAKLDTLIDILLEQNAESNENTADKKANKTKNLVKGLAKNSASILGLTAGMTSLKSIWAKAADDNKAVIKELALFSTATVKSSTALIDNINTGYTTMAEGLETQSVIFESGLGVLSMNNTESFIAMKALGVNISAATNATRFNVQALGMNMDAAVALEESIVESARANGQSISTLTDAITSMRDALVQTTVELGPEMAAKMKAVVARMAQKDGELAGAASSFVTSFLAGEQGFMKAARLGVAFTGQESEQQLVEKIQILSDRIVQMGAGAKGFGAGVAFQRFEDAFGLTRENFLVAEKMGRNIETLRVDSNKAAAENLKSLDAARVMEVAMFDVQSAGVKAQQGIAESLEPLAEWMPKLFGGLVVIQALLAAIEFNTLLGGVGGIKGVAGKVMGSGVMKAGIMTAGVGMMAKDIYDAGMGEDGGMNGKNIGGIAGGAIGAAIGSVLLPGIGTWAGMALGNLVGGAIGGTFDTVEQEEDLATIAEAAEKQQKDTEEIRRIQEAQIRAARSLASPQIELLQSINDALVRSLATLGTQNRLLADGNDINEQGYYQADASKPSVRGNNIRNW
tara:strand:- start:27419 stop:29155 length:1737 start_codon:yes stop_codon:yes gene_type:complete